ncbi:hypothetical protein KIPB_008146 [Kipferlia bialata]|uniref:Protein kinase domain-containing protein n=1 Tax=Kipferlia bialata TaxID=797122 RepID=A0A391NQT0_9EUKA|nr:hypothetical protein KIPB_008146 [Kipferlia bialata]|eukprot:g8146.t1
MPDGEDMPVVAGLERERERERAVLCMDDIPEASFSETYESVGEFLGEGCYGQVVQVRHRKTGLVCAAKFAKLEGKTPEDTELLLLSLCAPSDS